MSQDDGNEGGEWSFTVTDLEPLPETRVGKLKTPTIPRPAESDNGHTVVDLQTGGRNAAGEVEVLVEEVHESLLKGNLRGTASKGKVRTGQTIVERYQIEESIASGGMGRVHRVTHLHLGKTFALKQIHDSFSSDESFRSKFYQEARLASGLSHRNIVSIVDFGEDPDIGLFMVMELEEGNPLTARLKDKEPLPLRMACEIILQVADAMHYIHKRGIVHGDIKPDNILLRRAGRSEMVRWNVCLLDFGLARSNRSTSVDAEHIEGTPAYMAPEVICGEPLRESADIYSMGILAYHLITGRPPFVGDLQTIMSAHLKEPPPAIAEQVGEPVDERLNALIMKALEKDPKNRQASMAAFLFEIKTLMDMLGFGQRRSKKPKRREVDDDALRLKGLAFEHCGFGISVLAPNGSILMCNEAFARFFQWELSEVTSKSILDPRLVRIHATLPDDLTRVAKGGRGVRRLLSFESSRNEEVQLMFELRGLGKERDRLLLSIVPI